MTFGGARTDAVPRDFNLLFWTAVFALTIAHQLALTALGIKYWPFHHYRLFSSSAFYENNGYDVRLFEEGLSSRVVPFASVLPIESFRSFVLYERVFLGQGRTNRKEAVCRYLLDRLNREPWYSFDQVQRAPSPASGSFSALEIVLTDRPTATASYPDRAVPTVLRVLHRCEARSR